MAKPVFYDPRQLRWRVLRRLFDVLGVTITLLVVFFIYTAIRDEQLPGLFLPAQKRPIHALKEKEKGEGKRTPPANCAAPPQDQEAAFAGHAERRRRHPRRILRAVGCRQLLLAAEYARQIDLLYPEWLHVLTPDGHVQGIDQQTNKFFDVVQDGKVRSVDDEVMPFLKSEDTGMEVFPLVNNFDETEWSRRSPAS